MKRRTPKKSENFVQVCYEKACASFVGKPALLATGALATALGFWIAHKVNSGNK